MRWTDLTIGDCVDFSNGFAFKSANFTDNISDIPLVKGENLGKGEVMWNKSKYWNRNELPLYEKFVLKPKDIILAMDRPWVSGGLKYAIITDNDPESLLVQRVARLRANKRIHYLFLKHIVGSEAFALYIKNIMGGVGVPHISPAQICSYCFKAPDLPIQQKIGSILSAYDDLIENNTKRIKLLEEAAQNIYIEWFVHFHFPGYEKSKFENGLPKGWRREKIGDVINFINGFAFKSTDYIDGGKYKIVTIKNVGDRKFDNSKLDTIDELPVSMKEHCRICEGDILLSLTGNVGRTCLAYGDNLLLNQRVAIVKPFRFVCRAYIYALLGSQSIISMMNNLSSGVAQQNLSPVKLAEQLIVYPSDELVEQYSNLAEPMLDKIIMLAKYNEKLQEARDILLPRLMNGEIEVDATIHELEEA